MATIPMTGQSAMFGVGVGQPQAASQGRAQRNRELFELQRRARRGPTPEVFFAKYIDNSRIVKADDPERRREMRSFTRAMTVLFLMVMVYVWQHFSAIEVSYHIESQKYQVAQMQEQNRQLRLSEAEYSNPVRIDQIARQLGLDAPQPGQMVRPNGASSNAPVLAQASTPVLRAN